MNETNAQKIYYKKMINERFLKKFQKIFGLFSKKFFQKIHRKYRSFWSQIDDLNMGKQIVPNQVWWGVVIWHSKFPKSWVWAKSEKRNFFWKFQLWLCCKWSLLSYSQNFMFPFTFQHLLWFNWSDSAFFRISSNYSKCGKMQNLTN